MKLLPTLLGAVCACAAVVPAAAAAAAAGAEAPAATTAEGDAAGADAEANATEVAKVNPSQLRQNFNSDRTEAWGDIELVGGGQKWEYVKGLFGGPLACTPQRFVMAEPRLGCEPLTNPATDVQGSVVIISRGECSFADKVAFAQDAGAAGVIIGNTGEELIRIPAGWMKYPADIAIKIPVVIVRQTTAMALRKIISRDETVHGQVVAKHWTVKGEFPVGPCADQLPVDDEATGTGAEVEVGAAGDAKEATGSGGRLVLGEEGGQIVLDTAGLAGVTQSKFEYLYGRFGGPRPQRARELIWADPVDACTPLANADAADGKFVLVKRGGCPFTDKGHHVDAAGGAAAVVINNAANIVQMAQGDVKDYFVTTPTVMVSNAAGDQLATALEAGAAAGQPVTVSFRQFDVQANMWDSLNNLKTPQKWPVADTDRAELYASLSAEHDPETSRVGSVERKTYLDMLFAQATKFWGASI